MPGRSAVRIDRPTGRRFLGSGAFLLLLAAAGPNPGPDPGPDLGPKPGPDSKLAPLTVALAQAQGRTQAMQLEYELEALRQQSVQPMVRLLQRRAQRELAAGQRAAALSDLDDAVGLQPDAALLWRERAAARAAGGELDQAAVDLGGALSRDPADVLAWQSLAGIEEQRASWMAAYQAWQHVLSLDPQVEGGARRLDRLRRHAYGQPA